MREVGGLVQFVHAQTFHPVEAPAAHDQRSQCAGLIRANNNEMKFAAVGKCVRAGLYPGVLVHWTVGILGEQGPTFGLVFDCTEFLDNSY
jgi:hypothetical protein